MSYEGNQREAREAREAEEHKQAEQKKKDKEAEKGTEIIPPDKAETSEL